MKLTDLWNPVFLLKLSALVIALRNDLRDELTSSRNRKLRRVEDRTDQVRTRQILTEELLQRQREEIAKAEEERLQLKRDLDRVRVDRDNDASRLRHLEATPRHDTSCPVSPLPPPETIQEAVEHAREHLNGLLIFGDDIDQGIRHLAHDAVPPCKLHHDLETLAEAAKLLRQGVLGKPLTKWLREHGCPASGEAKGTRKSREKAQAPNLPRRPK